VTPAGVSIESVAGSFQVTRLLFGLRECS